MTYAEFLRRLALATVTFDGRTRDQRRADIRAVYHSAPAHAWRYARDHVVDESLMPPRPKKAPAKKAPAKKAPAKKAAPPKLTMDQLKAEVARILKRNPKVKPPDRRKRAAMEAFIKRYGGR